MQGAAVHIIGAVLSERRRPRRRRLSRICPMRTIPIAIGWCRRRHGNSPRYEERERGQCEALVTVVARIRVMRIGGAHYQGEEDGVCKSRCGVAPCRLNHGEVVLCCATSSERFSSRSCRSHLTTFASSCPSRHDRARSSLRQHLGWGACAGRPSSGRKAASREEIYIWLNDLTISSRRAQTSIHVYSQVCMHVTLGVADRAPTDYFRSFHETIRLREAYPIFRTSAHSGQQASNSQH